MLNFIQNLLFFWVNDVLILHLFYQFIFFFLQIPILVLPVFILNVLILIVLIRFDVWLNICDVMLLNFNIWIRSSSTIKKLIYLHLMFNNLVRLSNLNLSVIIFLWLFNKLPINPIIVDFVNFFDFIFVV